MEPSSVMWLDGDLRFFEASWVAISVLLSFEDFKHVESTLQILTGLKPTFDDVIVCFWTRKSQKISSDFGKFLKILLDAVCVIGIMIWLDCDFVW